MKKSEPPTVLDLLAAQRRPPAPTRDLDWWLKCSTVAVVICCCILALTVAIVYAAATPGCR